MVILSHVRDALFELDALVRYRDLSGFRSVDWNLKKWDLVSNTYSQCRRYFGKGADEGIYGETPLQTIEAILRHIGIGKNDLFVDLGCGRGRLCFFVASLFGCSAKGIDLVPSYIKRAEKYTFDRISFHLDDYKNHVQSKGIYYWYALTASPAVRRQVERQFTSGAIVITISDPIEGWDLLHEVPAFFPWGKTKAYVQRKR